MRRPDRALIRMTLYDVAGHPGSHMTARNGRGHKRNTLPSNMRTRVYGEDNTFEGSVFQVDEDSIKEPPFRDDECRCNLGRKIWGIDSASITPSRPCCCFMTPTPIAFTSRMYQRENQTRATRRAQSRRAPAKCAGSPIRATATIERAATGKTLAALYREQTYRCLAGGAL